MKRVIFLILLTTLALFSCKKDKKIERVELVIAVPKTISSIPLLELDGKVINGITIKTEFFQDHIVTMAEFVSGKREMIMTGFTQGVATYHGNPNIRHLVTPVWGVSSLISNDANVKSLEDLKGKKVLVPFKNSPLDLQLKAIIKKAGLEGEIVLDYAPPQQAVGMLVSKKADAVSVPEPLASKLIAGKKGYKVFSFAERWGELYDGEMRTPQVSLFVSKGLAEAEKKSLKMIVSAIEEQIELISQDQAIYAAKYAQLFELPEPILKLGLKSTLFDIPSSKESSEICLEYLDEIEFRAGEGGKKTDKALFFTY